MDIAPGFYAIIDPEHTPLGVMATAEAVLRGGCSVLQLRAKGMSDRELFRVACELRGLCQEHAVPFVVNDRVDVAITSNAEGVHLGQDDLPPEVVREHFTGFIGFSTHSLEQAISAHRSGAADLIGFGPVFDTSTKKNPDPTTGIEALHQVCREVTLPVVAIGGVKEPTLDALRNTGATWACAITAVTRQASLEDIESTARRFHVAFELDRGDRSGVLRSAFAPKAKPQ